MVWGPRTCAVAGGTDIVGGMKETAEGYILGPAILRLLAFMIDSAVLVVINLALIGTVGIVDIEDGRPANAESLVALILTAASYHIGFTAARSATLGKMAMNIYVAYPDSTGVRPDTAILRYIVLLIENLFVVGTLISLVLMFVDRRRRTLHDRVAGTLVLAGKPGKPLKLSDVERPDEGRL